MFHCTFWICSLPFSTLLLAPGGWPVRMVSASSHALWLPLGFSQWSLGRRSEGGKREVSVLLALAHLRKITLEWTCPPVEGQGLLSKALSQTIDSLLPGSGNRSLLSPFYLGTLACLSHPSPPAANVTIAPSVWFLKTTHTFIESFLYEVKPPWIILIWTYFLIWFPPGPSW